MPDSPSANHFLWTQPDTVWRQLLRPWLEACARSGWEKPVPPATTSPVADDVEGDPTAYYRGTAHAPLLLAPDAGMIAWIKGRAVAEGLGLLGVHFHTAGTLRSLLAQAYGIEGRLALREDLHLIMGQAARSLPANPVAQAAVLDPAALARLCDRIDRAGWRGEGFSTAAGRELATRYFELLAAQGLRTVADSERELLQRALARSLPACGHLLAVGFGSEHSDNLLLLRTAVLSAREPILCLDTTGAVEASPVPTSPAALAWQACCEEYFGLPHPLVEAPTADPLPAESAALDAPATLEQAEQAALAPERAVQEPELVAQERAGQEQAALEPGQVAPAAQERAALDAWARALEAHTSVEPTLRATLQGALRLLTFRTPGEEARHAVSLVQHWLRAQGRTTAGSTVAAASSPRGLASDGGAADAALPQDVVAGSGCPSAGTAMGENAPPLRIGIIVPGGGSLLGREIAAGLSALGIAHYDSLGHQPASAPAQRLLEGWCNWQNSNQVDDFNAFVAELCRQNLLLKSELSYWQRAADKALSQTLCAELAVVAAYLGGTPQADGEAMLSTSQQAVRKLLANWPQLPEQASFADFWEHTQPLLALLGWPLRPEPLAERALAFGRTLGGRLPRSAFINWLRSVIQVPGRTRNALGHEPFAKVHLVTLAEANRQQWSHLCVVGMAHGQWPPLEADSALLDPERCAELNRRAERPSRFGHGQSCIGGGHTFLASARQRREAFDTALLRLLGQTGAGQITLSRYRFEAGAQSAEAFASEYFLKAVYAATGSLDSGETPPLSPSQPDPDPCAGHTAGQIAASARGEQNASDAGLSGPANSAVSPLVCPAGQGDSVAYPQVAFAYQRRRDPSCGFDAYLYALSAPPPEPLRLSCSHWAEVLTRPAHAWYRYVLRLKKRRRANDSDFRQQSQGIWVHQWLNPSAGSRYTEAPAFVPRPGVAQWRAQVGERAENLRRVIAATYLRAGRQLPQWWQSDWSAALAIAESFAETLGLEPVGSTGEQPTDTADAAEEAFSGGKLAQGAAPQAVSPADTSAAFGEQGDWLAAGGECPLGPLRFQLPGHPLDGVVLEGIADLILAPDTAAFAAVARNFASKRAEAVVGRDESGSAALVATDTALTATDAALGATDAALGATGSSPRAPLWVVDYKTGADASLSLRSWESKGAGLQLVLYGFALRACGAAAVRMTMLRKGAPLQPQLELDEISTTGEIWHKLALPMRHGVFGMRGALRDAHTFSGDYPIATLPIDPAIVERKARQTLATVLRHEEDPQQGV